MAKKAKSPKFSPADAALRPQMANVSGYLSKAMGPSVSGKSAYVPKKKGK